MGTVAKAGAVGVVEFVDGVGLRPVLAESVEQRSAGGVQVDEFHIEFGGDGLHRISVTSEFVGRMAVLVEAAMNRCDKDRRDTAARASRTKRRRLSR